jgi:Asp-tRNA(Asn)/Glu-tRNA(Gln) amidotransferase B subunit
VSGSGGAGPGYLDCALADQRRRLGGLIDLIEHGAISGRIAEGVFSIMLERS